jgi:hypothetical protein
MVVPYTLVFKSYMWRAAFQAISANSAQYLLTEVMNLIP